ncbi:hypothetical protein [Paraburkholderia sp. BCC1886]|uniref:hypothetical protein n=1 Tax=Paraburkholderia sp. BCC1886 TaxID=2562670 RepID=UPI001183816E|nr:hypothetical protein [Paraburkholderia sp. BCC1886]
MSNEPVKTFANDIVILRHAFGQESIHEILTTFYRSKSGLMVSKDHKLGNGVSDGALNQYTHTCTVAQMYVLPKDLVWARAFFQHHIGKTAKRLVKRQAEYAEKVRAAQEKWKLKRVGHTRWDALRTMPSQLRDQLTPYVSWFESKWREIRNEITEPLQHKANGDIDIREPDDLPYWLEPGVYIRGQFPDGNRMIALGTQVGPVVIYETPQDVDVPKEVHPTLKIGVTSYRLQMPDPIRGTGMVRFNQNGRPDLGTYLDIFGYTRRPGHDDHNSQNLHVRLSKVFAFYEEQQAHRSQRSPMLVTPATYGGFRGAFVVANGRAPTEQEIFDAGMRGGRKVWGPKPAAHERPADVRDGWWAHQAPTA